MKFLQFIVFVVFFIFELESTPVKEKESGKSNDSWIIYQVTEPVEHAEGPIWDGRKNIFYYVDIQSQRVLGYNYNTKKTFTISLNEHLTPHFPSLWSANLLFVGSDKSRVAVELNGEHQIINRMPRMVGLGALSASASASATATAGPGMTATATASATSTVTHTSNPVPSDSKVVTGGPVANAVAVATADPTAVTSATATATAIKGDVKNGNLNFCTGTLGSDNGTTGVLTSDREILNMVSKSKTIAVAATKTIATAIATAIARGTATAGATASATATATATGTGTTAAATSYSTSTGSAAATTTATATGTGATAAATATANGIPTSNPIPSDTKTVTASPTAIATATATAPSATATATATATVARRIDKNGRLWIGSMGPEHTTTGVLAPDQGVHYRVTKHIKSKTIVDVAPLDINNGLVWNKDHTKFYLINSLLAQILEFNYNLESGDISNYRVVFNQSTYPDIGGYPDGMTSDKDDNIWLALHRGAAVLQVNPRNGKVLQSIPIPARDITSVMWGGPNLDVLFVTTSRNNLSEEEKNQYPDAGSVFAVNNLKTSGLPISCTGGQQGNNI